MFKPTLSFFLCMILLLTSQTHVFASSSNLDSWLDSELLPFLEDRLGRHPRLKGQPFEIVAMKGNEILAETDRLTGYIRQRIIDRLQAIPTANRALRPSIKPWRYPRKLRDLDCNTAEKANVQIGIEVDQLWQGDRLRVSVQAIDLIENSWVRGFKKVWEGQPNPSEKEQLKDHWVDDRLLGTRALPFRDNQPDLLSSLLAKKLSCLLQETGESKLKVFTPDPDPNLPVYFKTAFELLDHYLSRFRELEITHIRRDADVMLKTKVHHINGALYQVWVGLQGQNTQIRIAGLGSEAYAALNQVSIKSPRVDHNPPLIALFELIAPRNQSLCKADNPWTEGEYILHPHSRLANSGCFAVRYQAGGKAKLYILSQTEDGQLTQLFPDNCDALGLASVVKVGQMQANQVIHAPMFQGGNRGYFRLDFKPSVEWVYAVSVSDQQSEEKFLQQVGRLESLCNDPIIRINRATSVQGFQASLDALTKQSDGKLQWQALSFIHGKR